jgi:hypothetical protein
LDDANVIRSGKVTRSGVPLSPKRASLGVLTVSALVFLISAPLSYGISGLLSRAVLLAGFVVLLIYVVLASFARNSKIALIALLMTSCMFLLWRFSFIMPPFVERALNSETYVFAEQYGETGHLVFGSAHSYFFAPYMLLYVLYGVCSISASAGLYVSLFVYGVLTALVATLILRVMWRRTERPGNRNRTGSVLAGCVAFSVVSFMYSARGTIRLAFPQLYGLVVLLAISFVFTRGLKRTSDRIVELLLVVGLTLGSSDGILLLVPFFFLFSILRRRSAVAYALIPLGYMVYAGYSYLISLAGYWTFAWEGFSKFAAELASSGISGRIFPWERLILTTKEDAFVTSATYISFLLLCLVVAVISTLASVKEREGDEGDDVDVRAAFRSSSICLWLMLAVACVTFVGTSIEPETFSSDTRTLAIALPSILVPFAFMSRRFIAKIRAKNLLVALIIMLMIFGSLRTIYEVYPKSVYDPINVVEDERLGLTAVYAAAEHIRSYHTGPGIVADYKVLLALESFAGASQSLSNSFDGFREGSILAFNIEGIEYPSMYYPSQAYVTAYSLAMMNNRVYDNGVVLISSVRGGPQ